jgi:hypothetical protein
MLIWSYFDPLLTENNKCHAIEPTSNICQQPQQQTKLKQRKQQDYILPNCRFSLSHFLFAKDTKTENHSNTAPVYLTHLSAISD